MIMDAEEMTFEEAMQSLEDIVARMEEAKIGLDESIDLYEEAARLKVFCESKIRDAEQRIEKIIMDDTGISSIDCNGLVGDEINKQDASSE